MGSLIDTSVLAGARDVGELSDDWAVSVVTVGELEAGIMIAGDDATYSAYVNHLTALITQRDALAASMIQMLESAAFNNQLIDESQAQSLISAAQQLLESIPSD